MEKRCLRWQRISREAVKQCRRTRPMTIDPLPSLNAVLESTEPSALKLAFWEASAVPLADITTNAAGQRPAAVVLLIGPEGGFTPQEMAAAGSSGFQTVSLGPRILRAETATITAAALIQHRFGDMV